MLNYFFYLFLFLGFIGGNLLSWKWDSTRITFLDIAVTLLVFKNLIFNFKKLQFKTYFQIFLPFILVAFLSLVFNFYQFNIVQISLSSLFLLRFIIYSLLFLIYENKFNRYLLPGSWLSGVFLGLLGLIQYFLYPNLRNLSYLGWDPHQYRVFSTFLDPNFTGIILVLTLILGLYLYTCEVGRFLDFARNDGVKYNLKKVILLGGQSLTLVAFFLTYSRGSYVALIMSLAFFLIFKKQFKLLLIFIVFFISTLFLLPKPAGEGINLLRIISIESRVKNTFQGLKLWQQKPILGHGFNTLKFVNTNQQSGFHNSFIYILTTTGILGLISFGWIFYQLIKLTLNKDHSPFVISLVSAIITHSFFDNSLFYSFILAWVWLTFGVLIKGYK